MAREPFKNTVFGIIVLGVISGFIANQLGVVDLRERFEQLLGENERPPSIPHPTPMPGSPKPTSTPAFPVPSSQPSPALAATSVEHWKLHKNLQGNFSALFPHEPQDETFSNDDFGQAHLVVVADEDTMGIYGVFYGIFHKEQKVDEVTYNFYKKILTKDTGKSKCEVTPQEIAAPTFNEYIVHSYRVSCLDKDDTKMITFGNFYLGKHYSYAVLVIYPSTVPEPPAAKSFFESFSIIDKTK